MVFAEYQDPYSEDKIVVEYDPTDNIYSVNEYRHHSYPNVECKAYTFDKQNQYLEYVWKLRDQGYTRKGIF